jgi:anti-sigma regulatory factor (Ser/Thr protein kinase)
VSVMSSDAALWAHLDGHSPASAADDIHLDGLLAARTAREFVRRCLTGLPAELIDSAELLASEVVTNGILHARTGLEMGVSRTAEEIAVVVRDANDATPQPRPAFAADELAQQGRGMAIIVALADDFGWRPLPDGPGKVVWFTLKINPMERDVAALSTTDDTAD